MPHGMPKERSMEYDYRTTPTPRKLNAKIIMELLGFTFDILSTAVNCDGEKLSLGALQEMKAKLDKLKVLPNGTKIERTEIISSGEVHTLRVKCKF